MRTPGVAARIGLMIGVGMGTAAAAPATNMTQDPALAHAPFAAAAKAPRMVRIPAAPGAAARALAAAHAGDTLVLSAGVHDGPLEVRTPVVLRGEPGAIVDGAGRGSVIRIAASGTIIEDLGVRGSGDDLMRVDGGVLVVSAANVVLRRLSVSDVLYGITGERAIGLTIEDCVLTGRVTPLDARGEGNGIHLWYCRHVGVRGCSLERFLDAIYLSFTHQSRIERSTMEHCGRYGLHTMYSHDDTLLGNRFAHNVAGCALMFANRLRVQHNDFVHNRGDRTYGLLLNDCGDGSFLDNRMVNNTIAVFMDNANRNRFRRNLLQDNGWGLFVFSSSADNEFAENNFIQNDYPVALDMRRTTNRFDDGRQGNYWSGNAPYDIDADGVSDVPYSPVSAFAFASKQYPDLTILAKSPAVAALAVAERVVPALRPSQALDRYPRVAPVVMTQDDALHDPLERPRPLWGAFAGFLALAGCGLIALRRPA